MKCLPELAARNGREPDCHELAPVRQTARVVPVMHALRRACNISALGASHSWGRTN